MVSFNNIPENSNSSIVTEKIEVYLPGKRGRRRNELQREMRKICGAKCDGNAIILVVTMVSCCTHHSSLW